MKRRKGRHRKKWRLRHDYRAQFMGTLRNHFASAIDEIFRCKPSPLIVACCHRRAGKESDETPRT